MFPAAVGSHPSPCGGGPHGPRLGVGQRTKKKRAQVSACWLLGVLTARAVGPRRQQRKHEQEAEEENRRLRAVETEGVGTRRWELASTPIEPRYVV